MEKKRELTLVPIEEIPSSFRRTKLIRILEEFTDSGIAAARVDGAREYKGLAVNLNRSAKRFGLPVEAITRNGTIYLLRVEPDEQ